MVVQRVVQTGAQMAAQLAYLSLDFLSADQMAGKWASQWADRMALRTAVPKDRPTVDQRAHVRAVQMVLLMAARLAHP